MKNRFVTSIIQQLHQVNAVQVDATCVDHPASRSLYSQRVQPLHAIVMSADEFSQLKAMDEKSSDR